MKIKHSIECWIIGSFEDDEKALLLAVAANERHPAFLQPITGGIEDGETSRMACVREIREETGLFVEEGQINQSSHEFDVMIDESLTIRKTLFSVRLPAVAININPSEHIGYQWVPIAEVPRHLFWESNQQTWGIICSSNNLSLQSPLPTAE